MDPQVIDQAPNRWKHSTRRRIDQVENVLRAGPFRQDPVDKPSFNGAATTCSGSRAIPIPRTAAWSLARRSLETSRGFNSMCCDRPSRLVRFHRAPPSTASSVLATVSNRGSAGTVAGHSWSTSALPSRASEHGVSTTSLEVTTALRSSGCRGRERRASTRPTRSQASPPTCRRKVIQVGDNDRALETWRRVVEVQPR
jgi:hypothetical protein